MSKQLHISIPVSIFKEEDAFVAYTPALDISTCAGTLSDVKKWSAPVEIEHSIEDFEVPARA